MKSFTVRTIGLLWLCCFGIFDGLSAQDSLYIRTHYTKSEHMVPMRDGVKLFTAVYAPKDPSQTHPIMLTRTPYSCSPYGLDAYKKSLGPSGDFAKEGYIFVYQDVRGRFMSEGEFVMMRPHNPKKKGPTDIDESSDTYDTIEWLLKNIPNDNGRVGMWGISYRGFYVTKGIIDSHPALKAASPQAPIADMFIGDDFHHNGAFFLAHAFRFLSVFGKPRLGPTTEWPERFDYGTPDGYNFFLKMGPLSNANDKYFKNEISIWNDYMDHPNYDEYWKAQNVLPHLKNIKSAVMTVGGWFDSEDSYAPLNVYETIEKENPNIINTVVMGPWSHGGWARTDGDKLGNIQFGYKTGLYFRKKIELLFFNYYLKDSGELNLPEALVFETGTNEWRSYDRWPPKDIEVKNLYFHANGKLSFDHPMEKSERAFDEYISDPSKPVPFTAEITTSMGHTFMVEDQRFAWTRPDVLVYESDVLTEDITIAGPIIANLYVSTTGTDSDWIVKFIDVYPDNAPDNEPNPCNVRMGGYQMLLAGEVMRAKFRNSYERPKPMVSNKVTKLEFELRDKYHTFLEGHKIMVQVQSTWFPLVDLNPQKFVNIYRATDADFQRVTQRVYHSKRYSSHLKLPIIK
ncbi:CocE/NonD family hydrolase [candidate division KSB1 bacterium]|nr:CocE/NonD family hydrolase [candidate division KSB1 bacterium]